MRFWIVALVATIAGQAQAATEQFDLVCRGTLKTDLFDKNGTPYSAHYRVDLAQMLWCLDECSVINHIADVDPTRISFEDEDDRLKGKTVYHYVERVAGDWTRFVSETGPSASFFSAKGVCEPVPYSGINPPQTKF
jgi:hypothetical protein